MPRYRDMPAVSKGEINRCGDYLVELHRLRVRGSEGESEYLELFDPERVRRATQVVDDFRAAHQKPLSITSVGLRQFVGTSLNASPIVSQRLKRLPRIIRKLANMERSNLARLEDIGGTRAVVRSLDDQARLCGHIEQRWGPSIKRGRDYVADPKPTGYRARHYVIEKDDRRIEVQVRTISQQAWANAIEQADSRLGLTLKDGTGPESMLDYFSATGDMLYYQDAGIAMPAAVAERFERTSDRVVAEGYFVRRRGT